ncbi:MAG: DUF4386 family protein [Acidobacteria bacterium]|nr:DUF4386 family protein [Acidobacteriota bacterium]
MSIFDKADRATPLPCLFLRVHHYDALAKQICCGVWLLPFGLLVYRSRFPPRILGLWLVLACFGY